MSALLEKDKVEETVYSDSGEHDRFAHYFKKNDVDEAIFTGKPAVALCGKKDVPMKNPDVYPVCKTCQEVYELLDN